MGLFYSNAVNINRQRMAEFQMELNVLRFELDREVQQRRENMVEDDWSDGWSDDSDDEDY